MPATVAIAGRPNVGKSTLFNRLIGRKLALVDNTPGVTRDRREGDARLGALRFTLADTAGLETSTGDGLGARMSRHSEQALSDADVCLFMVDARAGITAADRHLADLVRRRAKAVILLANKAEGGAGDAGILDAYSLGLSDPVAISAVHGEGLDGLHDRLAEHIAARLDDRPAPGGQSLRLAVLGRPNTGKSTLINRLTGHERMLTGPEAGVTRDAVSVRWQWRDQPVTLWDTAGVRRRSRVNQKLEKLSVADALRAVRFAEVVVLMFEACQALERQDLSLAEHVVEEGRAPVIAINKWDLVKDKANAERVLRAEAARLLPRLSGVPIVTMSAMNGKGVGALMPAVMSAYEIWNRRISTARLNQWLDLQTTRHPPPAPSGRRIKLRYMTQPSSRPPTFAVFCSRVSGLPDSYKRYLINNLRKDFNLPGAPLRLHFRQGKNPYAKA